MNNQLRTVEIERVIRNFRRTLLVHWLRYNFHFPEILNLFGFFVFIDLFVRLFRLRNYTFNSTLRYWVSDILEKFIQQITPCNSSLYAHKNTLAPRINGSCSHEVTVTHVHLACVSTTGLSFPFQSWIRPRPYGTL